MRYWRRGPYLGFGLDAHSMLRCGVGGARWANGDQLDEYLAREEGRREQGTGNGEAADALRVIAGKTILCAREPEWVGREQAFEEAMFLGLRMNQGVDLDALRMEFGAELVSGAMEAVAEIEEAGLIERDGESLRLTARGRMVSNEVFSRLLVGAVV